MGACIGREQGATTAGLLLDDRGAAAARDKCCGDAPAHPSSRPDDDDAPWASDRCSSSDEDNKQQRGDKKDTRAVKDVRVRDVRSADYAEQLSRQCHPARSSQLSHRFEALTNLCSNVCKVPLCCITDLQCNQNWTLQPALDSCSSSGNSSSGNLPFRGSPFCTWTLQQPPMVPLVVEDTLLDNRFSSSPHVVQEPYIRFYAGVPLVSPEGAILGALCIMDTKPAAHAPMSVDSRLSLLSNFTNMALRELKREHVLTAQQVAGDALQSERTRLLRLMDLVGHRTATMLIEVPAPGDRSALQSSSVGFPFTGSGALLQASRATSCMRLGWRVLCVNEAWEASTGHVNAQIANQAFWSLSRAQGDEAVAEKTRKACVSAVAGQLDFSATLMMNSGAGADGDSMVLRLLFNRTERSRTPDSGWSSSTNVSQANLSSLFAGPSVTPSTYYFVSIASASNPIVPASNELKYSGWMLSAGLTLLAESGMGSRKGTPRSSVKLEKLEDRSMQLLDDRMNVTPDLQIESLLGHGSFGRVYKGRYNSEPVAVKVLQCNRDQAGGHELEALLPAHIEHPNVLRTYKHCTRPLKDDGEPLSESRMVETWMVMEYAEHGSLSEAVRRGRFHGREGQAQAEQRHFEVQQLTGEDADLELVLDFARDVAAAMCHLHSLDILHGDLTGSNILLCSAADDQENRSQVAKVADFGLSRILASEHIRTKTYGAVSHTPPELLLTGSLSKAVDVYAFGVILWEMMTGQQPYRGLSPPQIISHISNGRSLDIHSDWPSALRKLIASCLSTQPGERPSFLQVLLQLDALQEEMC